MSVETIEILCDKKHTETCIIKETDFGVGIKVQGNRIYSVFTEDENPLEGTWGTGTDSLSRTETLILGCQVR